VSSRAAASVRLWLRAMPTMLRVGAAEALAYRVEFIVWMLTTTMPLVMLGLWTTVASEAPFAGFDEREFVAYYLSAFVVRTVTGTWVVWQINEEIRHGTLSMRLLRPVHPFVTYAAAHFSSIPLRSAIALPVAGILLASSARGSITGDPVILGVVAVSLIGAWLLTFFLMVAIGSMGFVIERSIAVFELYLLVSAILSGYLIPLELLPGWVQTAAAWLPFRYMLAFPVEALTGRLDRAAALEQLGIQWLFAALLIAGALAAWRAGMRRYEAYGS
jgi:ABC-2 type transport system permease protein